MNTSKSCSTVLQHSFGQSVYIGVQHSGLDVESDPIHAVILQDLLEWRDLLATQLWGRGMDVVTDSTVPDSMAQLQAMRLSYVPPQRRIELHVHAGLCAATGILCFAPASQYGLAQALTHTTAVALGVSSSLVGFWQGVLSRDRRLACCQDPAGIVVECFFLTNATERQQYAARKQRAAAAMASVLARRQALPLYHQVAALPQ